MNLSMKKTIGSLFLGISYIWLTILLVKVVPAYKLVQLFEGILVFPILLNIYIAAIISSIFILILNKFVLKFSRLFPGLVISTFAGMYFLIIDPWPDINFESYLAFPLTFVAIAFLTWCPLVLNFLIKKSET